MRIPPAGGGHQTKVVKIRVSGQAATSRARYETELALENRIKGFLKLLTSEKKVIAILDSPRDEDSIGPPTRPSSATYLCEKRGFPYSLVKVKILLQTSQK